MSETTAIIVNLGDVCEIEEAGQQRANQLLGAGFHLLALAGVSWEANRRKVSAGVGETFIRHEFRYVIGRTADEDFFPPREDHRPPAAPAQ